MTSRNENEGAVPTDFGVIAAFVDGESVNTSCLKEALNSPDAREYFVDLLALRASVRPTAQPEFNRPRTRGTFGRTSRWIAAGLMLGSLGGYLVGQHRAEQRFAQEFALSPLAIDLSQPSAAPAPTQIIRLEPGRNWETKTGGH
jgi:hypothetical protein